MTAPTLLDTPTMLRAARRGLRLLTILTIAIIATSDVLASTPPNDHAQASEELDALVTTFFSTPDQAARSAIAVKINLKTAGSLEQTAAAVARVNMWRPINQPTESLTVDNPSAAPTRLSVRLPPDYTPERRYPLVLALLTTSRLDPDPFDRKVLSAISQTHIVAIPDNTRCADFDGPAELSDEPRRWIHALKKRYRIDSDRIYLFGSGTGGDAAFIIALMHSDAFAATIVREGALRIPFRRELQSLLLPNLATTPTRLIWTIPNLRAHNAPSPREIDVALSNAQAVEFAKNANLPILAFPLDPGSTPDPSTILNAFQASRSPAARPQSHRFRYPQQSPTRFVRVGRFGPQIWQGDQLDIAPGRHVDRSQFIHIVLDDKLAQLAAKIDGQTIHVQSRRCTSIELLIQPSMLDVSKRVTIRYNGKRRFEDRLPISVATLLSSAYDQWEFQHPAWCRLRIGPKGQPRSF